MDALFCGGPYDGERLEMPFVGIKPCIRRLGGCEFESLQAVLEQVLDDPYKVPTHTYCYAGWHDAQEAWYSYAGGTRMTDAALPTTLQLSHVMDACARLLVQYGDLPVYISSPETGLLLGMLIAYSQDVRATRDTYGDDIPACIVLHTEGR